MEGMDSEYLKKTVGPALTKGLTSMVTNQPRDCVEYLGNYLLRYVELEEGKASQADLFARATQLAAEQEEKKITAAAAEAEAAAKLAANPLSGEEEVEAELKATTDIAELYPKFLNLIKRATGATSAYIGVKGVREGTEDEPAVPVISFIAGSEGCNIEGNMLIGQPEDDPEAPVEGVLFDLFVGKEPPEPEEPAEDDAEEPGLVYPEELVIPNVIRDPRIKFFGVPSIGAFAAVPLKFKSCLHAEGGDEEGDGNNNDPQYQDRQMVLCFHTMGQGGRQFTRQEIARAKEWASKLGETAERAELTVWTEEVVKEKEAIAQEKEVGDVIAKAKAEAEAECEAATNALPEDMIPELREFEAKKLAYAAALKVLNVVEDKLEEVSDRRLPLKADQVRIMHAMLYTLLQPKESFVEDASRKVNWSKMRKLLKPKQLMPKVKSYDPANPKNSYPRYARVDDMRKMLDFEELPSEALFGVVFEWCSKAVDVREAAVAAREAAAEAAAAEAAEGDE